MRVRGGRGAHGETNFSFFLHSNFTRIARKRLWFYASLWLYYTFHVMLFIIFFPFILLLYSHLFCFLPIFYLLIYFFLFGFRFVLFPLFFFYLFNFFSYLCLSRYCHNFTFLQFYFLSFPFHFHSSSLVCSCSSLSPFSLSLLLPLLLPRLLTCSLLSFLFSQPLLTSSFHTSFLPPLSTCSPSFLLHNRLYLPLLFSLVPPSPFLHRPSRCSTLLCGSGLSDARCGWVTSGFWDKHILPALINNSSTRVAHQRGSGRTKTQYDKHNED